MALSLNDTFYSDPYGEMRRMQKDMDNLYNTLSTSKGERLQMWKPLVDIKEQGDKVSIHAELPGVKKEDINIELKDGMLTISGEKRDQKTEKTDKYHRVERSFGKFSRSMAVPKQVTEEQIKANFDNGVLEVSSPRPQEKQTKRIKVN